MNWLNLPMIGRINLDQVVMIKPYYKYPDTQTVVMFTGGEESYTIVSKPYAEVINCMHNQGLDK